MCHDWRIRSVQSIVSLTKSLVQVKDSFSLLLNIFSAKNGIIFTNIMLEKINASLTNDVVSFEKVSLLSLPTSYILLFPQQR